MINFEYKKATTVKAALQLQKQFPTAMFIAGGTNLVDLMKKGVMSPPVIIDITELPLKYVKKEKESIVIGALTPNSDLAENELINTSVPLLAMALKAGASAQLRNMATVGGNLMQRTRCGYFYNVNMPCNKRVEGSGCAALEGYNRMHAVFNPREGCIAVHPSDMAVALQALQAKIVLEQEKSTRSLAIQTFYSPLGNRKWTIDTNIKKGEIIKEVMVPANSFNRFYYLKIRDRASYAFALLSVAVALQVENNIIRDASLAMGGVAGQPWPLPKVNSFLIGKSATKDVFVTAGKLATENAKAYAHNAFKIKIIPNAIAEALNNACSTKV